MTHRKGTRAFESPHLAQDPVARMVRALTEQELRALARQIRIEQQRRRAAELEKIQ